MIRKILRFAGRFTRLYTEQRLAMAAATLSYYLTMTFCPLIIVLYSLLGNSYDKAMRIVAFAEHLMAVETVDFIREFLAYVASHSSAGMTLAGITVLVTSASAAVRTMQFTIGAMQGGQRFRGVLSFLFSVVFSVLLVAGVYFGVIALLSGRGLMSRLNEILPAVDISGSWNTLRFLLLAAIEFFLFWSIYASLKRREDRYSCFPGAILATATMVAVSLVFSVIISASVKYPLIYGSLASVILLMMWLYFCSLAIFCGAALNIVIRDEKEDRV